MNLNDLKNIARPGGGNTSVSNTEGLVDLITHEVHDAGIYVELGTAQGSSAMVLASMRPNLNIFTIDRTHNAIAEARLKDFPNVKYLVGDSVAMARDFGAIDYVYLDTVHSYDQVSSELHAWEPKVTQATMGHDYFIRFPGVQRAIMEYFRNVPFRVYGDSSWVHRVGHRGYTPRGR